MWLVAQCNTQNNWAQVHTKCMMKLCALFKAQRNEIPGCHIRQNKATKNLCPQLHDQKMHHKSLKQKMIECAQTAGQKVAKFDDIHMTLCHKTSSVTHLNKLMAQCNNNQNSFMKSNAKKMSVDGGAK